MATRITDHVAQAIARLTQQFQSGDVYVPPALTTGPIVSADAPTQWLRPSTHLVSLPAIDRTSMIILHDDDFASWTDMLAVYPNVNDYLLTPGDYRSWGEIFVVDSVSGTSSRVRTLRYWNPADDYLHPVLRAGGNEALVQQIHFEDAVNYWHLDGLTLRGTGNCVVTNGSHHITFDRMLIEDMPQAYGVRILSQGGDVTVQRCVIRNEARPDGTDSVGVQILPDSDLGYIPRSKILDCEIYNLGDAFATSDHGSEVGCDFIVDGCDFYILPEKYRPGGRADGENACDIKEGSVTVQSVIKNSRFWGFRRNVADTGAADAVICHRFSNNILIENCIFSDSGAGWREVNWPVGYPDLERERNYILRGCGFDTIRNFSGVDTATCVQPVSNTLVEDCTFARSDYAVRRQSVFRAGGPTFDENRRIDCEIQSPDSVGPVPYTEPTNTVGDASVGVALYERRRWTGSEVVAGPFLATDTLANTNHPPVPGFVYALAGGQVSITSTATDPDGTIASTSYTFGDGGSSSSPNPSHTYTANGVFSITQTVTDDDGASVSITRTVEISGLVDSITMPTFQAAGTLVHSINFIDVAWPAHVAGDVALLITERGGDVSASSLDIPAGFVQIGSSVSAGNTNPTGTRLDVYWCRADQATMDANGGSMPPPRVSDNGNHQAGVILTFRNCIAFGSPVDTYNSDTDTTTTTAVSIPGSTTATANCRVVAISTSGFDITTAQFSGWTNATLSGLTEIFDVGGDSGNGGVIGVATGGKAVAGAYGATTATLANAAFQARMSVALRGAVA